MVPAEAAHDTIGALGDAAAVQFKDLNAGRSAAQRPHVHQVRALTRSRRQRARRGSEWAAAGMQAMGQP
jgi:V-type H+-transporting ATPase subunit a